MPEFKLSLSLVLLSLPTSCRQVTTGQHYAAMMLKSKFTFERFKLCTTSVKTSKDFNLDGMQYNKHTSAATLQNALHGDLPDLLQEVGDLKKELQETKNEFNLRIGSLEAKSKEQGEIMSTWQTAHLVFYAFGVFAWGELSAEAKAQLAVHSILDFSTLFYRQSSGANDAAATAARVAYQLLTGINHYAPLIIRTKQVISKERTKIMHPTISQEYLDQFLDDLGNLSARSPHLPDLEHRLFHYLRTMSITPANIQGAK